MAEVQVASSEAPARASHSYLQILKSTTLIGGSSFINIGFAIVRNKAIAALLGPQGVGVMALYNSIIDLAQTFAGLGVQASGVRQIAEAQGKNDDGRVALTATVVRRTSLALAILGAAVLALGSSEIATFTFGDATHATAVAFLGAAVFFQLIFAGEMALIQGTRRIADLARVNVFSALFTTVISVPTVYLFGLSGIAPALIAGVAASLATSWWYCRKIRTRTARLSLPQFGAEASSLLKLGVVFMASAAMTVGAGYAIRLLILREQGVAAAGFYQAAWAIGGIYVAFILQAMGTDFYPRLTAVASDDEACNRMVNEQAQISMLLAGPGVIATLTAAPFVISIFYTSEFLPAVDVLRAICLGMTLRVIAWPMGFIVLAKGSRAIFFWTEVAATTVHVGLAWLLLAQIGIVGAGVAFLGLYVWHSALIYVVVRRLSGFRWSRENLKLGLVFLPAAALVFGASLVLPFWQAALVGATVTVAAGVYSIKVMLGLFPDGLRQLAARVRPARAAGGAAAR